MLRANRFLLYNNFIQEKQEKIEIKVMEIVGSFLGIHLSE